MDGSKIVFHPRRHPRQAVVFKMARLTEAVAKRVWIVEKRLAMLAVGEDLRFVAGSARIRGQNLEAGGTVRKPVAGLSKLPVGAVPDDDILPRQAVFDEDLGEGQRKLRTRRDLPASDGVDFNGEAVSAAGTGRPLPLLYPSFR